MRIRVKICCICSLEEAALAISYRAHAIGLVGKMPSGPGPIPDELILKIKELGGTGRVHNWSFSRKIVESVRIPVFLAGGLTSENVAEAIDMVQPFGVDVCSGVRINGCLDERKLVDFISEVYKL